MFKPKQSRIVYRITASPEREFELTVDLNEHGLMRNLPATGPAWTCRDAAAGHDCPGCNTRSGLCDAALSIVPLIEAFHDLDSLQEVSATVLQEERALTVQCPAPRAVASVMGLLLAASGCPRTTAFRAMALYHLPFATAEETVTRAASFWLLNLWAQNQLDDPAPFHSLLDQWEQLEDVNLRLAQRIRDLCPTDAAPNALAGLDMLAKIGRMGLESRLEGLRTAFLPPAA